MSRHKKKREWHPLSDDHKRRIGLKSKGHVVTHAMRKRIGDAQRGKKVSDETKAKLVSTFFKVGLAPWNKGKRGVMPAPWNKGKPHEAVRGNKNPNWKGGVTEPNSKIRRSLEYRIWRTAVFVRDGWTCVWCGAKGVRLNADHIKRFSDFPELRFAIDNGRTLCEPCHRTTETFGRK